MVKVKRQKMAVKGLPPRSSRARTGLSNTHHVHAGMDVFRSNSALYIRDTRGGFLFQQPQVPKNSITVFRPLLFDKIIFPTSFDDSSPSGSFLVISILRTISPFL